MTTTNTVAGPSIGHVTSRNRVEAAVRAVDLGGLVELPGDRDQTGEEQHHVEAERLPDADARRA